MPGGWGQAHSEAYRFLGSCQKKRRRGHSIFLLVVRSSTGSSVSANSTGYIQMVRKITGSVLQPLSCSCLRSLVHEAALLPAERIGCSLVEKTVRDRDAKVCFRSPVSKRVQQVVVPQRKCCPHSIFNFSFPTSFYVNRYTQQLAAVVLFCIHR